MSPEVNNTIYVLSRINRYICQIVLIFLLIKLKFIYAKECQIQGSQIFNSLKSSSDKVEFELNGPEFEVEFYNISIVENLPNGFSVLQVIAHNGVRTNEFTYELEDNSGAFLVEPNSGWLIVRNSSILDREKQSVIKMKVYAVKKWTNVTNDNSKVNVTNIICLKTSSFVNVEVMILDVNDNNPIFFPSNYYELISLSNVKIGATLGKVEAIDRDQGRNGLVSYRLQRTENVTSPFAVDTYTGEIYVTHSPIIVGKYIIFIEAMDNPLNPSEKRFSLAVVTINIIQSPDYNSEVIKFIGIPYKFWIGIDVPIGSTVGQILINNSMKDTYIFDLLHSYKEGVPFAIEEKSGIITVVDEIRKYEQLIYEFEAVIINNNDIALIANVTIHIDSNVINTDSNIDKINKIFRPKKINTSQVFHISENSDNLFIGRVESVTSKMYEDSKFCITNQEDVPEINLTSDGFLYANHALDREEKENYSITIKGETSTEIEIIQITIIVDDENDNAPVFNSNSYEGYIVENSPTGTEIVMKNKVFASDIDNGINGTFIFDIWDNGNGDSHSYKVEKNTGKIFYKALTNENLDREIKSIYNMKIVAIDKGSLQSEANLTIKIQDINDNAPNFTEIKLIADQNIQILGNAEDTNTNNALIADGANFFIHKDELNQDYYLNYYDSYNKIKILQRPIFYISKNVTLGTKILKLEAHDNDEDENALITYSIQSEKYKNKSDLSQLNQKHFIIDSKSGEISIVEKLPSEIDIWLYVRAIDGGNLTDEIVLKIHIALTNNTNLPRQQRFLMSFFQVGGIMLSCIVFIATFSTFLYLTCKRIPKSTTPFLTTNILTNHQMQSINLEQLFSKNFQLHQNTHDHESNSDIRLSSFPNCRDSMGTDKKFVKSTTSLYSCCHDSGVVTRVCHCNNIYNSETSSQRSSNSYEDSLKSFQPHSLSSNIESFTIYPTQMSPIICHEKRHGITSNGRQQHKKSIEKQENQCDIFSGENNMKDILIHKQQQPSIFINTFPLQSGAGNPRQVLY
ncbi:cadherin-89D isoform X2 [Leptopilina boulardi]|uniref:cadherin-89D isoform X2 n=1 Tax=Leptopilina boulardi TaxID=63433 RepID=UPI0021F57ED8|nr:cadherin-89D isoform X2 [Leptopilina boulardi]